VSDDGQLWLRVCLVSIFVPAAAATVAIVRSDADLALTGDSAMALTADVVAGALVAGAAIVSWRPGPLFPVLFGACAVAWLIGDWNTPSAGAAFTAGIVLYAAWPAFLAAAALRGLDERPFDRSALALLTVGFGAALGVLGLASALVADPAAQGCSDCPANVLNVTDARSVARALGHTGLVLTVAWSAAFVVVAALRLVRSSSARKRLAAPVLLPAVVAVALVGIDAAHGIDRGFMSNDGTDRALHVAEAIALSLAAAGVGLARLPSIHSPISSR